MERVALIYTTAFANVCGLNAHTVSDFSGSLNVELGRAPQKHLIIQYFHHIRYKRHH